MKKFKIIACVLLVGAMLGGCAVNTQGENENTDWTESTTNQTTTSLAETTLNATDVALTVNEYDPEPIVWGPGNITDHQRPTDPENLQNRFSELSAQWLLPDEKRICLTFDEGYENGFTAQILDTLKEKKVAAIFFCTYDYIRDNPELVQRIIDEGHILANHSFSHKNFTQISLAEASDEITLAHDFVAENYQYNMQYFRFPEGAFSEQTIALVQSLNYRSVFWSFAYADWETDNQPDEAQALEKILSSTHNGEIMLLHAVSKTNANIMGEIIDGIRNQGYEFTTEL